MERLQSLFPLLGWHPLALIPDIDAAAVIVVMQTQDDWRDPIGKSIVDQVCDRTAESHRFY